VGFTFASVNFALTSVNVTIASVNFTIASVSFTFASVNFAFASVNFTLASPSELLFLLAKAGWQSDWSIEASPRQKERAPGGYRMPCHGS
jgi:hypothetical protein